MFKKSILLIVIVSVFIGCKSTEEVEKPAKSSAAEYQKQSGNSADY